MHHISIDICQYGYRIYLIMTLKAFYKKGGYWSKMQFRITINSKMKEVLASFADIDQGFFIQNLYFIPVDRNKLRILKIFQDANDAFLGQG